MKTIYTCTVAMLMILAGTALFRSHVMKAGPSSATTPNSTFSQAANPGQKMRLPENYGKLPLSFEANQGQTDARVKFLSRGRGYTLFLTGNEAVLTLQGKVAQNPPSGAAALPNPLPLSGTNKTSNHKLEKPRDRRAGPALPFSSRHMAVSGPASTALRMRLIGANASAAMTGADELPGKSNYFIGNDPKKWRTNVPNYGKVKYAGVYPGVDLVCYGNQGGQLEYDFVVAPGADPAAIRFTLGGREEVGRRQSAVGSRTQNQTLRQSKIQNLRSRIDLNGDLIVTTDSGEVRFHKPVVYQEQPPVDSSPSTVQNEKRNTTDNPKSKIQNRKFLAGRYTLDAQDRVRFQVAPYDHSKPLFIDPVLSYSTYLGGGGEDYGQGIAVDFSGNAYVTGSTNSTDFPTANPIQGTCGGCSLGTPDAFVAKLNAAGSALVYSTYLGGSSVDFGSGIAVDSSGNAYVTGSTYSIDFPTVNPVQATNHGSSDAFVAKLNAAGSALVYSTYLGGSGDDAGYAIGRDSSGNAYLTGSTDSTDFPNVSPLQGFCGGCSLGYSDAFVAKLNAAGSALVYSTYLGGSDTDFGMGIGVDSSDNAYVTGETYSINFPTVNPIQASCGCGIEIGDAFVAKLNATGSALVYSTYLGGSNEDLANGIAVDSSGNAYVTGYTSSTDFPIVNPLQATNHGFYNAFVTKLNAAGSALFYSTYLGGSLADFGYGIAVDSSGNAYVTGSTFSADFPIMNPIQATCNGGSGCASFGDAFVTEFNPAGSALVYSTYLGGSGTDQGNGIAVDSLGNAYVSGRTGSTDFPSVKPLQASYGGGFDDAIVAKISLSGGAPSVSLSPTSLTFGPQDVGTTSAPQTVTLSNTGNASLLISGMAASGDFAQVNTCGSTVPVGGSCIISVSFTPTSIGMRTGAIMITDNASDSPQSVGLTGTGTSGGSNGTINVTTNTPNATFALTGPANFSGTGTSATFINAPPGTYTITYGPSCRSDLPPSSKMSLSVGGTISFTGTYAPGFLVDFPLKDSSGVFLSPCAATINAVFDHFQKKPYDLDAEVEDYVGEEGLCNGPSLLQNFKCPVGSVPHYGFRKSDGQPFTVTGNGNYTGGPGSCKTTTTCNGRTVSNLPNNTFLFYQGHPGYDYFAGCYTPVFAAADGTLSYPPVIPGAGSGSGPNFHALKLTPNPANGYAVYYLHLSTYPDDSCPNCTCNWSPPPTCYNGMSCTVKAGDLIGLSGDAGVPGSPHLHFEVQTATSPAGPVPVDPYGWKGSPKKDPYKHVNRNLWR